MNMNRAKIMLRDENMDLNAEEKKIGVKKT